MSYILEALKKAEAERRQEPLPGLHTQPLALPPAIERRTLRVQPVAWSGAATLVAIVLGLLWWKPWQPASTSVPVAAPSTAPARQAAESAVPPVAVAPPADVTPPTSPLPVTPLPDVPAPRTVRPTRQDVAPLAKADAESAPAQSKADKPAPPAAPSRKAQERKAQDTEPVSRKTTLPKVAAAPPEEPIATLRELPESVQRAIPPLQVEGYIYAEKPSARSVLINRRLVREGDQVAPDLLLEKMTPSGMVFNYRGHRFRTSY